MTQEQALTILKLGKNVFLTGAPGAGKTYVLNKYIEFLQANDIQAAVTAYTGIAASHINGRTLHSWAGLSFAALTPEQERERVRNNEFLIERINSTDVLIIDEVSMLHPAQFERVDFICKTARNSTKPFGGLQLICCGDFFQIPPVEQQGDEFVIDSNAWKDAGMQVCYLHEQHRQGDKKLLAILQEIRKGVVSQPSMELLNGRMHAKVDAPIGIARLYTHNENVDKINGEEIQKLPGDIFIYEIRERGQAKLIEKLEKEHRIEKLLLKKGARVMFTRNNPNNGYANGTLGEIIDFYGDDEGEEPLPIVKTFSDKEIRVAREQWTFEEDGEVKASVSQVPLRLAWAITVHKSQGMTLDAAEIDLSAAFEEGMGYVALSRVKQLESISLLGFNKMALEVNERIKKLDAGFWEKSELTEHDLQALSPADIERLQNDFIDSTKKDPDATPPVEGDMRYEVDEIRLPRLNRGYWCLLSEVQRTACDVAQLARIDDYEPSLEGLINDFAALTRYNKEPADAVGTPRGEKIFRYVLSATDAGFYGTSVPHELNYEADPPYKFFRLDRIANPGMFVTAEWAKDVLRAIFGGAIAAIQVDEKKVRGCAGASENKGAFTIPLWDVKTTEE